jgi:putative restriction endonuclease
MPKAAPVKWTREHQLIALNLYCKLPFGKLHRGNGIIKDVAARMGRTANSLALKLVNFASLDPVVRARGKRGMSGARREDRRIWDKFQQNLAVLGPESEELLHDLVTADDEAELDLLQPEHLRLERRIMTTSLETEAHALVKVRRGQQFFRQSVLRAYDVRCCITGINVPELLVASHIRPWRDFPEERLDPSNGLCLSSLHDRAFDAGLIALDEERKLLVSPRLHSYFPSLALEQNFAPFEGVKIRMPVKLAEPSQVFLSYHRQTIFNP